MTLHDNSSFADAVSMQPLFRPTPGFTEGFTKDQAWLWLVSHASTRSEVRHFGKRFLEIQRGECAASTRELAARFRWSQGRTRRFLKSLQAASLIDSVAYTQTTVITVKNYDALQSLDSLCDSLMRSEPEMVATHLSRRGRLTEGLRKISKALRRAA